MAPPFEGIIVLGTPRSGTTLMRRLLSAHPRIHCPPETHLFAAAGRFLRAEPMADGLSVGVLPGLAYAGVAETDLLDRLRDLTFGLMRRMADRQGKRHWAEKTSQNVFYLDEIARLCGDRCLFVVVVRHGLDVACSIKELVDRSEMVLAEIQPYVARSRRPLEAFAHVWVDTNQALERFMCADEDRTLLVRYEDLLREPVPALGRLFDFLGEPVDPAEVLETFRSRVDAVGLGDWKAVLSPGLNTESVERWRGLGADTIARLGSIANGELERLGYEAVPTTSARAGEQARRRYEVGLMVERLHRRLDEDA